MCLKLFSMLGSQEFTYNGTIIFCVNWKIEFYFYCDVLDIPLSTSNHIDSYLYLIGLSTWWSNAKHIQYCTTMTLLYDNVFIVRWNVAQRKLPEKIWIKSFVMWGWARLSEGDNNRRKSFSFNEHSHEIINPFLRRYFLFFEIKVYLEAVPRHKSRLRMFMSIVFK